MKCTIPGANMKVLGRAIQALSRIGDELYVDPDINSISLKSVNSSRSAYSSFTFNRSFFAFYKHEPSQTLSASQETNSKCKISMKSVLPVFRSPVMLDRKVENCLMRFDDDGCKIIFEMKFRNGFTKTHFLPVIECETLEVVYTKNNTSNCLLAQVQLFLDTVRNFHSTQEEVTLLVTSQKTSVRSYVDSSINSSKVKSTEIVLDPGEFDKYTVTNETEITFCLKEFRALLAFAEATNQTVEAYFETGGKPVMFGVKHESTYEASIVLSTLSNDVDSQSQTPQRMRQQTTNSPTIDSAGTISKERLASSTSRQNTSQQPNPNPTSSVENLPQERIPELRPCSPRIIGRPSVRREESPSLLSTMRSTRNLYNSPMNELHQSNSESSKQLAEKTTNNESLLKRKKLQNDVLNSSQQNGLNNSHAVNNRIPAGENVTSQERISRNSGITPQDFNTPPIRMSNASTISLNVRESDNEDNDTIPSSPQPPRRRPRLSDIFDATFDPNNVPGYNVILVDDSGDEDL